MAKLFSIRLGVEPIAVGATLDALKKMRGVLKIDLDLEKDTHKPNGASPPAASGGTRGKFSTSGVDTVIEILASTRQPQSRGQLVAVFEQQGRSPTSINSVLHTMRKAGDIQIDAKSGGWVLTKKARDRLRWRTAAKKKSKK